jgi:hypothetical protein
MRDSSNPSARSFVLPIGEPTKTIFHESWQAARNRSRQLPRKDRALFSPLLDSVESAWPHVRTLQHLHDQLRPGATGAFARVLDFVDDHVCDLFRSVAGGVVVFVPGPGGEMAGNPDFNNTDADADQFGMFVALLRSACCDPEVPPAAAALVRQSTEPLLTWYERLRPPLERAADAVEGPVAGS